VKRLVNFRMDEERLAAFDAWAEERGWSRTRAIERLINEALAAGDDTQHATRNQPRSAGSASARGARSTSPPATLARRDVIPIPKKGTR